MMFTSKLTFLTLLLYSAKIPSGRLYQSSKHFRRGSNNDVAIVPCHCNSENKYCIMRKRGVVLSNFLTHDKNSMSALN